MALEQNHLLIIEDDRGSFEEYLLNAPLYSVGRDPKCDIQITSAFVSRRQATLVQILNEDGSFHYRIVDGIPKGRSSANGMLINGRKIRACDLQDNDEIVFVPHVRAIYRVTDIDEDDVKPVNENLLPTQYWYEAYSRKVVCSP